MPFNRLDDLTVFIPVRFDSVERIENTIITTNYLLNNFDVGIILLEVNQKGNNILQNILDDKIEYVFIKDDDPIFFRTKYINRFAKQINTPFIAVWDIDVIIPPNQIIESIAALRNNASDFVYPYDKYFLDTSPILRKLYIRTGDINFLLKNMKKMKEMYPPNPLGGAFLANMKAYRESGFENENFYGWGLEDGERYHRWEKLGYRIKRIPGPLFHLSHGRGLNSTFHDADQNINKRRELMNMIRARVPDNKDIILT